jgi:signal transduction histidine kinase
LLIGLPITLLLASAAGYAVAAGALRPVERMRGHAARISEATPDARLPLPAAEDELHRLGETLNDMLARLATAAEQERAFVTNASHELRTPLAILKAEVEVALHPDSTPAELRRGLQSAGEEADRLARLAEDLLLIARGEPGAPPPVREELALADLTQQVAARFEGTAIHTAIDPHLRVYAERGSLDRALTNLIDNARRHGAEPIEITAHAGDQAIDVHVIDHGHGFSDDFLPHAFERFSRPADTRSSGAGLGLALVEAVAHAHGGQAGAGNAQGGADVWLSLPRERPQPQASASAGRL